MPYQPTKEHLDHQIPDAFKSINSLMRQLKQDIGMDAVSYTHLTLPTILLV